MFLLTKAYDQEECLSRAKRFQARCEASEFAKAEVSTRHNKEQQAENRDRSNKENYSVVYGSRTLAEWIEVVKKENERLLHELQESKSKERIYKFGLERFSGSSDDIKFYTGFPDYPTLIEFWKYVEPRASDLTYYSYLHDSSDSINVGNQFPYLGGKEKKFPGCNVGC